MTWKELGDHKPTIMDQITVGNVKWVAGSDESFTELASSFADPPPLRLSIVDQCLGFFLDPQIQLYQAAAFCSGHSDMTTVHYTTRL